MNNQHHFYSLLDKYILGEATAEEKQQLATLLEKEGSISLLEDHMRLQFEEEAARPRMQYPDKQTLDLLLKRLSDNLTVEPQPSIAVAHRVHFLRRGWFRYAAAIIIIMCAVGAYFWTTNKKTDQTLANGNKQLQPDVPPGGDKAVLTLGDGSKIILDSAANGDLADQGGVQVIKLANGQLLYQVKGLSENEVMLNTMSTPVGGQYQVVLPDGTKVWLNAASSITYPTAFNGKNRQVKISGEAYFEVVSDKTKPFMVDVDGRSSVQVLGTSFNINSYRDEPAIKTTLLEGSLKVTREMTDREGALLKPGQQASISDKTPGIVVSPDIDLAQTIAWKNGLFNFNGLTVHEVLNQLARWYDIKIQIRGKEPDFHFMGEMYRNVNLSDVLEMLKKFGVKFRMEGKTLIVIE